jgi:hypothetical protein
MKQLQWLPLGDKRMKTGLAEARNEEEKGCVAVLKSAKRGLIADTGTMKKVGSAEGFSHLLRRY